MKKIFLTVGAVVIFVSSANGAGTGQKEAKKYLRPVQMKQIIKGNALVNYPLYARGKKGRKYVRRFSLKDNLKGDKLLAYETYGNTPHRLRFRSLGKTTERWRYYSLGLELTFDGKGKLISKRHFPRESGHID